MFSVRLLSVLRGQTKLI